MRWLVACCLVATSAVLLHAGCEEELPTETDTGGMGGMASDGGGGAGGEELTCPPPAPPNDGVTESVGKIIGQVRGLDDRPVPMILADVCGINICLASETDDQGNFDINGDPSDLEDPRLVYGDGLTHAKLAGRITVFPDADMGQVFTALLPTYSEGVTLAPGDVTQGRVTLHIEEDSRIDIDIITYVDESERGLRTTVFTPDQGTFLFRDELRLEVLVGIAPIHTLICPAAGLTIPNEAGWDAGAEVEIMFNNVEIFDSWAAYGDWAVIAEATVSADGTTITTKDGEGIHELGTIGARLKE